jgi:hypothetical protein
MDSNFEAIEDNGEYVTYRCKRCGAKVIEGEEDIHNKNFHPICHKCGKPAFCLDKSGKPLCQSCAKSEDRFDRNQATSED